jgi:hypothetical protein
MNAKMKSTIWIISIFIFANFFVSSLNAQQILLDKPVRAGELILFPAVDNDKAYYYVPDKPRLATSAEDKPQFSFLQYVTNIQAEPGAPGREEGEGGGIVHALVALKVTDEQLQEAQRELQRITPDARIEGPVVFKSGTFGLVSSFKEADGKLTTKVVGLGKAPLLDGEKAAISMQLTKLGSMILWESFQTPTPDISFTFEMEIDGYQSPRRAVIEANFDQIYEHEGFAAGVATPYIGAEIKATFDDLRRKGAIKLTQVGSDEKLESLITTAYNKITEMMFSPIGGTGTPSLSNLAGVGSSGPSLLDKASNLLEKRREETRKENERIRQEQRQAQERLQKQEAARSGAAGKEVTSTTEELKKEGPPLSLEAKEKGIEKPEKTDQKDVGKLSHELASQKEKAEQPKEKDLPSFAAIATFEMKRVRQRGTFKIDLNKYTADKLTLRFDENIGDLRSYWGDNNYFRQVNLDDPLFKQRQIAVSIDGLNASDFGEYINFVTVQMRKKHEAGKETYDEVRIDRANFNTQGNNFSLLYGWKDDTDRGKWFEYEYRMLWSFFGGKQTEQEWEKTTANALSLTPPYQRRSVELEADPTLLADAGVRLVTVKIYYDLAGVEKVKMATLRPSQGKFSDKVDFMLLADKLEYEYEITWLLRGQRELSSGRKRSSNAILFVDELPAI